MNLFKNLDTLRRFDSFSKTIEDFRVKTSGGGLGNALLSNMNFVSGTGVKF